MSFCICAGLTSSAQQNDQSASLSKCDEKIKSLKSEQENLNRQISEISADDKIYSASVADGSWKKYQDAKYALDAQLAEWEKIKSNLLTHSTNVSAEKVKITKAEFDALPEANQKAILSEPHRFEIVEQK